MYERKSERPLPPPRFARRLFLHFAISTAIIVVSIGIGILGYCQFEHLSALDGFLNSAMLLGGMGPVNAPVTTAGKLFAGCFALYAGLVFIVTAGLMFTPLLHRLMHHFHWTEK